MAKFKVHIRIVGKNNHAVHEYPVYEAESALDAIKLAQADKAHTSRGSVSTHDVEPAYDEPVIVTKGETLPPPAPGELSATEPMAPRRGRPPKHQVSQQP